jgi:hypothetical protein
MEASPTLPTSGVWCFFFRSPTFRHYPFSGLRRYVDHAVTASLNYSQGLLTLSPYKVGGVYCYIGVLSVYVFMICRSHTVVVSMYFYRWQIYSELWDLKDKNTTQIRVLKKTGENMINV